MSLNIQSETEKLLLSNYESYYRLAYPYVRNEPHALDIVQESACRAIAQCGNITNPKYLSTWIYRIVINTALDLIRKSKREEASGALPEAVWNDHYEDADLKQLLESLDEKSRTILILRYFEDCTLEEIARICGENLNTVKARLYRTLKKLRLDLDNPQIGKEI